MSFSISSFPRAAWEHSLGAPSQETVRGADKLGSHAARGNLDKGAARGVQKQCWLVITLLLCCAVFLSGPAFAAAVIKATPDHEPVRMDETFNLEFSSEGSVDDDPDFTPLSKDFEILGQSQNSEISIVNGKMARRQKWIVSLAPKRSGSIPIPAIAFGSDRSQPATVTVQAEGSAVPSPGGKENEFGVSLQVEAEPKDPYVQAQVIYTARLWIPDTMRVGGNLNDPQIDNALVERLFEGNGRTYSTNRGGRGYTVVERKYAVFPQNSGLLRIEPLRLDGEVEVGGRSLFDRGTRRFRVKSEGIDLKVRSIPEQFTGAHWLPAADLKLEEAWPQDPPQAKAGEPVTRTLTLRATGSTVGVLPELGADAKLDPAIKHYPDQPALTEEKLPTVGMTAVRQEKAALIPGKAGEFKLPTVEIPWWNTRTDRLEIARIPARVLKVEPSGEPTSQAELPAARLPATEPAPAVLAGSAAPKQAVPIWQDPWFWLAVFFGAGWLATGLAWALSRRALPASAKAGTQSALAKTENLAHKALRQACVQHDAATARQALLDWAKTRWPAERPASLGEVATLGGAGLANEIAKLNRSLYSHGGSGWQGEGLWAAVQALAWDKHSKEDAGGLEPLYR